MHKALFVAASLLAAPAYANELVVEAFHDKSTRIVNAQMADRVASVSVYDLSAPEKLEDLLSEGLSDDPKVAQKQANERIAQGGQQLQKQLTDAYEGSLKAMQYDIQKLPAVVFNSGEQVIYGIEDLNRAIAIYNGQVNK